MFFNGFHEAQLIIMGVHTPNSTDFYQKLIETMAALFWWSWSFLQKLEKLPNGNSREQLFNALRGRAPAAFFFLFVDLPSDFSSPLDMNFPVRNHISAFYHAREKSWTRQTTRFSSKFGCSCTSSCRWIFTVFPPNRPKTSGELTVADVFWSEIAFLNQLLDGIGSICSITY